MGRFGTNPPKEKEVKTEVAKTESQDLKVVTIEALLLDRMEYLISVCENINNGLIALADKAGYPIKE